MTSELSRHIEILLLDNDCVIVPGFGGFMAHHKPAEYVAEEGLFLPPQRTLGFNPQLKLNDSLLAQAYVEAYDISYPEAVRMIEEEVEEVKQVLSINGEYEFHGIGTIHLKADGNYDFEPCRAGLLSPSLYALYSYSILPQDNQNTINVPVSAEMVSIPMDEVQDAETETKCEEEEVRTINISINALRNVLVAAMILLLFVFSSIPAGRGSSNVTTCSFIDTELIASFVKTTNINVPVKATADTIAMADSTLEATATDIVDMTMKDTLKVQEPKTAKSYYTIVLASKVSKQGAADYVARLKLDGYKDASVLEKGSIRRVVFGRYASESEAHNALQELRFNDTQFLDAWISTN